jgi:hypothetical protein
MLELHIDLGVASELDLVILDLGWSGSSQTGAPRALVLYPNRKSSIPKSEGG